MFTIYIHYFLGTFSQVKNRNICECCGMQLRASPAGRVYKEKVRAKKTELMENVTIPHTNIHS
jgi:hypothetical protein